MQPPMAKLREIALNPMAAASVGWFCVAHAGHPVELRGDAWTYDHRRANDEKGNAYRLVTLDELAGLDEDIAYGRAKLADGAEKHTKDAKP